MTLPLSLVWRRSDASKEGGEIDARGRRGDGERVLPDERVVEGEREDGGDHADKEARDACEMRLGSGRRGGGEGRTGEIAFGGETSNQARLWGFG